MSYTPHDRTELELVLKSHSAGSLTITSSPADQDDALSLSALKRITLYEPHETIISCEAGLPLVELETELAKHQQWIPSLIASERQQSTLGATLAMDDFHPRRRHHSPLRTAVLGGWFMTMAGELFKSGSRVVKSVAGYDTHRAFVGSRGKFGAIVEVTMKVQPKPERFLRFTCSTAHRQQLAEHAASVLHTEGDSLLVEISGYEEDVAYSDHVLGGIMEHRLSDTDWNLAIKRLAAEHSRLPSGDSNVNQLFDKLALVFDPNGILRS